MIKPRMEILNSALAKLSSEGIVGRVDIDQTASSWTWLAVGGKPLFTYYPSDVTDLAHFCKTLDKAIPYRVFGAASNVLVRDGDSEGNCYDGVFIRLQKGFRDFEVFDNKIIASAGLPGNVIVNKALEHSLGGLSFMATIPGHLGGLVAMNAGAHGMEMCNIVEWIEVLDRAGKIHKLTNEACKFEYRKSGIAHDVIVLRACLNTQQRQRNDITQEIEHLLAYRKATQPTSGKMAGCFFKNPNATDLKAWQLIKKAQTPKSQTVCVSQVHANFIMNKNQANALDLEYFALQLQADIFFKQNVWLEMEIERIGYYKLD